MEAAATNARAYYGDTQSMITLLSGMTESELGDAATELEVTTKYFSRTIRDLPC